MKDNKWLRLLTYVTGLVNQELLLQNEYLAAENRILRAHLPARLRLSDPERSMLAEIGKRLGRKALAQVALVARPDTILALTWGGLVTYYVLFFIHLESRRISLAGITRRPDEAWMQQMARNATDENWGHIAQRHYALHDRDTKFCASFRTRLAAGGIRPIQLPARSPNLNAFAERWVRSVKQECLSKLILFGEASLRRALAEFVEHFHTERNHQGKGNILLFPSNETREGRRRRSVSCRERLGGLLKYYCRAA